MKVASVVLFGALDTIPAKKKKAYLESLGRSVFAAAIERLIEERSDGSSNNIHHA